MVYRYVTSRQRLGQLREEMDRLMSGFLGWFPSGPSAVPGRGQPAVNLWEGGDALFAELELPGVKSDQIEVAVVGDELSLTIRREDVVQEGVTYHRRERAVGGFTRVVRLPLEVDAEKVAAELRNGVLTITLPKAESAKPRKIQVASA
jgi:HSP20 family protein